MVKSTLIFIGKSLVVAFLVIVALSGAFLMGYFFPKPTPTKTEPAKTQQTPDATYKIEELPEGDNLTIYYKKCEGNNCETIATASCVYYEYLFGGENDGRYAYSDIVYYNKYNEKVTIYLEEENNKVRRVITGHTSRFCDKRFDTATYASAEVEKKFDELAKNVCAKAQEKVDYWLPILEWTKRCTNYKPPTPMERME